MSVHKAKKQAHKPVAVQNRSVLYEPAGHDLVAEGIHDAELVEVRRFTNAFGERIGLVFKITTGPFADIELMESARPSPRGKLAELARGLGGAVGCSLSTLVGRRCKIAIRHEATKAGTTYAAIAQTFP
jgi:hypothetical protein